MDSPFDNATPEPFWNHIERKTGMAQDWNDNEILKQLFEEWEDSPQYLLQRRWKFVAHLGHANLMPFGGEGKSLGTITVGLKNA